MILFVGCGDPLSRMSPRGLAKFKQDLKSNQLALTFTTPTTRRKFEDVVELSESEEDNSETECEEMCGVPLRKRDERPACTLTHSEAALRQHQHGSFAKKYRQRQRLRAEKDAAEQKMRHAIEEHFAEEKNLFLTYAEKGKESCAFCVSRESMELYIAIRCKS